ncbi:hypothetical protein Daesc_006756 [Daldinia eschscholtzii]|uniref:Uncharacterized protein n=1 Tax=Daldinia eschscholtzii TaxID=292717 RepID=A0AAX6MID6_9PEZI
MHFLAALTLLPLAICAPTELTKRAPVYQKPTAQLIPNKYIVKLKESSAADGVHAAVATLGIVGNVSHVYGNGRFRGFAAELDSKSLDDLQKNPDVDWIEQDAVVTINEFVTQKGAEWGLGRISHKAKGSTEYVYDDSAGEGTCAYVIDTGVYTDHNEFGGRATFLANYIDDDDVDGHGHGTHVAGTIGGSTYGVSKKTKIYAVKVLNSQGSGSISAVLAGMDFVAKDAKTRNCPKGAVANMSLGSDFSFTVNFAAQALVEAGVFLAVAAGNSARDARDTSPASEPSVCTVGASDKTDAIAYFSNYGSVVDVFAPGVDVVSSFIGGKDVTHTYSGTSMASPHVAGLGAYLLALEGQKSPTELCSYIQEIATSGALSGVPSNTKNLVAFNGNPSA